MQQNEMIAGLQSKVAQLDLLLHEALQEKMELKQQYAKMQNGVTSTMNSIADKVEAARRFIKNTSSDKEGAEEIIASFDENFGQFKGGCDAVDTNTVA